jgi:hypothetical protein
LADEEEEEEGEEEDNLALHRIKLGLTGIPSPAGLVSRDRDITEEGAGIVRGMRITTSGGLGIEDVAAAVLETTGIFDSRLETGGSLLLTDPSGDFLTAAGRKILVPILAADGMEEDGEEEA